MSDSPYVADSAPPSCHPLYERSPRRALAETPAGARAAWRNRYVTRAEGKLRAQAILDRAEAALRSTETPPTICTLWSSLADRAGRSDDADLRAAAALTGMAMGLQPS